MSHSQLGIPNQIFGILLIFGYCKYQTLILMKMSFREYSFFSWGGGGESGNFGGESGNFDMLQRVGLFIVLV